MLINKRNVIICISLLLNLSPLIACDGNTESLGFDINNSENISENAIIVSDVDWSSVNALAASSRKRIESKKVAYLQLTAGRCTGFLISEDVIMTNHHCVKTAEEAIGVIAAFNYEDSVEPSQRLGYDCSNFIGNNEELDYALLRCSGRPGLEYGYVTLESRPQVEADTSIYIIHQNCDRFLQPGCVPNKKISLGQTISLNVELEERFGNADTIDFAYDADTLAGSSGAPVFSAETNQVIGIHHNGRPGNDFGRGFYNTAVPMKLIIEDINTRFSEALDLDQNQTDNSDFTADSLEPNNSVTNASIVSLDYNENDLSIHDAADQDIYKINIRSTSDLEINIEFTHADGDLDMRLYKSNGRSIKNSASSSDNETIEVANLKRGTYYLVVKGYREATNNYSIDISTN